MRRPDWLARLAMTMRQYESAPFLFGVHDCGLFAARCVDAMTGSNWAGELYTDRKGAARLLHSEGSLEAVVSRRLGIPAEGEPVTGDVCQVAPHALGIFWAGSVAVLSARGLRLRPRASVLRHWRMA